ncbi:hypothetical protein ANO14919_089970 [Xylariales sp. No.14919]|nr:hypothetical protein ANO14919_089970 [Xylariales sp. No.14919]
MSQSTQPELETTLVDHIVQQAEAGLAPRRVVYIAGTELDVECARNRPGVAPHLGPNDYTGVLTIRAAKPFCDEHAQARAFADNNLVLMIDVRMAATVAEEVMFGLVLDRLRGALRARDERDGVHIAVFLLGSSWFSQRTFESFATIMQVARRRVQATRPPVRPTFCTDTDIDRILGAVLHSSRRIVSCRDASWNPFTVSDQVANFRDNNGEPLDTPMVPSDDANWDRRSIHGC